MPHSSPQINQTKRRVHEEKVQIKRLINNEKQKAVKVD